MATTFDTEIFARFLLHFWNLRETLRRMVYSLKVFEVKLSPQEPLKVKLSMKFQGVDFSISSTVNVLKC